MKNNYIKIIESICNVNNINQKDIIELLRKKDNKYLLLLMLKKYGCFNREEIKNLLQIETSSSVNYNLRKAEEKFFINRDFREKYIQIEKNIEKII